MSVHFVPANATGKHSNRTVKHSRAYCHCINGYCEDGFQTNPKKKLKERGNLSARLAWFGSAKPKSNYKKPGSNKK